MKYLTLLLLCVFANANTGFKTQEELSKAFVAAIKKQSKEDFRKLTLSLDAFKNYMKDLSSIYPNIKMDRINTIKEVTYNEILEHHYNNLESIFKDKKIDPSKITYKGILIKNIRKHDSKDLNHIMTSSVTVTITYDNKNYYLIAEFTKTKAGWFLYLEDRIQLRNEKEEQRENGKRENGKRENE